MLAFPVKTVPVTRELTYFTATIINFDQNPTIAHAIGYLINEYGKFSLNVKLSQA